MIELFEACAGGMVLPANPGPQVKPLSEHQQRWLVNRRSGSGKAKIWWNFPIRRQVSQVKSNSLAHVLTVDEGSARLLQPITRRDCEHWLLLICRRKAQGLRARILACISPTLYYRPMARALTGLSPTLGEMIARGPHI